MGDFGVSAAEEQSSIMSDTSNIVNYSTPSPSMSSSLLMSPSDRQMNQGWLKSFTVLMRHHLSFSFIYRSLLRL